MIMAKEYLGKMDMDAILDKWEREDSQAGRFKPKKPDDFNIRICPSTDPTDPFKFCARFGMHWNVRLIAKNAPLQVRAVACLYLTLGQDCPLCREVQKLYDAFSEKGDEGIKKLANSVRGKPRFAMNVIDVDDLKASVRIWEIPNDGMKMLKACLKRNKKALDPVEGQALAVTYGDSKGGFLTVENIQPTNEVSEIPVKDWFEKVKDLDEYVQQFVVPASEMKNWITEGTIAPARVTEKAEEIDDLFNTDDTTDALETNTEDPAVKEALGILRGTRKRA
jgi:thiol-disulfide isomerase/thioredoxin